MTQFRYLKYDLYRYFYPNDGISSRSFMGKVRKVLTTQGIWAIIVYRFRRWYLHECNSRVARSFFRLFGWLLQLWIESVTGISISPDANIGPGFYIGHFGNIFVGGNVIAGKFFNISHECTVGFAGRGNSYGSPEIGNFVYMAPGAKVIGKIQVGSHVAIGANSVLTKSLPDNAVVFGIPARIINYDSSKDFILFNQSKNKEIL